MKTKEAITKVIKTAIRKELAAACFLLAAAVGVVAVPERAAAEGRDEVKVAQKEMRQECLAVGLSRADCADIVIGVMKCWLRDHPAADCIASGRRLLDRGISTWRKEKDVIEESREEFEEAFVRSKDERDELDAIHIDFKAKELLIRGCADGAKGESYVLLLEACRRAIEDGALSDRLDRIKDYLAGCASGGEYELLTACLDRKLAGAGLTR